jgi:riboflavin kinase/FMN adenylyltransferase
MRLARRRCSARTRARVFQPDAPPFALMTDGQRARALKAAGAGAVFHIPFDRAMAAMTPEQFVRDVLA